MVSLDSCTVVIMVFSEKVRMLTSIIYNTCKQLPATVEDIKSVILLEDITVVKNL